MNEPGKKQLLAIGEALIDFIPAQTGCAFDDVTSFSPAVGGAPANVCGAFVRLGGRASLLTQLGDDPFGHKIERDLAGYGIDTSHISFTDRANTSLAFVSLAKDGNRTFSFYRKPAADMLYAPEQVEAQWFADAFALHFCSVSLGNYPMKEAHRAAIACAEKAGCLISFDPNLRFPLWPDRAALKQTVQEFLPQSHIVKISDEELEFLTGQTEIEPALPQLLTGSTQMVIYTCGSRGAWAITKKTRAFRPAFSVEAVDTTGAGDGFIGAFLYQMMAAGITPDTLPEAAAGDLEDWLAYAHRFCSLSVQGKGAIASYPTAEDMK